MIRTELCELLGIELPIVQAPIGRVSSPQLAAAVSNAGALGMLGLSFADAAAIRERAQETDSLTDRPFGANLILKWDQHERLAACLDAGIRLISYFLVRPSARDFLRRGCARGRSARDAHRR